MEVGVDVGIGRNVIESDTAINKAQRPRRT